MLRSLYVLRHAKAEELPPQGGDRARDLKRRGGRDARAVGRALSALEEAPELVLCSSAVRARRTAELAREEGGWDAPLETEPRLYEATAESLLECVRAVQPDVSRVLLVGHQPSLGQLIALLTGSEPALPTAACARIDLACSHWQDAQARAGQLVWLLTPDLAAALRVR